MLGYISDPKHSEKLQKSYEPTPINLTKYKWAKKSANAPKDLTLIHPPISMDRLVNLLDIDEYHYACVDAIAESCFIKFECNHPQARDFLENIQLPKNEDIVSIFSDFIHYYIACGNGFLLKMRNVMGHWVGLNRLIPTEVQIVENFDEYGFLKPDYLQVKSGQKTWFSGRDIIHMLQTNSMSNAWGISCKPIIYNIETLHEIKNYDFNRFKNGLLLDHFIIVEGGSIGQKYIDENGKEVDPHNEIINLLKSAKGTAKAHSTIFVEVPDPNARVRLEPLRQNLNDFQTLKKDLRDGIIVYHRVPHRLVSQETPGKLGGNESGDLTIFYNMVVKPLQERVAFTLCRELREEFGWEVNVDDFDFGSISEVLETIENRIFRL